MTISDRAEASGSDVTSAADPAIKTWFLTAAERGNPATDLRAFTVGNRVEPLIDGENYFARLYEALRTAGPGDHIFLVVFRGDTAERLAGPGTGIGDVLAKLAAGGVRVFGLIWRSQPDWLDQSEGANAELVRTVSDAGGEILLDARTRRAGSHHQKFVVVRHPSEPSRAATSRSSAGSISG